MINKIKKIINKLESKQVGILYHYTNPSCLLKILKDNVLKSSRQIMKGGGYNYISFTRDSRFSERPRYGISGLSVRIEIDGDKLSNNHKIEPYNYYYGTSYMDKERDEREERVIPKISSKEWLTGTSIKNFNMYINKITLNKYKFIIEFIDNMLTNERKDLLYILSIEDLVISHAVRNPHLINESMAGLVFDKVIEFLKNNYSDLNIEVIGYD